MARRKLYLTFGGKNKLYAVKHFVDDESDWEWKAISACLGRFESILY